jgi:uncharacterized membrane protein YphA (DoxX/SURF4 family)
MIRGLLVAVLLLHGLIHVMGFAKAFRYAELPQLTQPISRGMGVLWLLAALVTLAAAACLVVAPRLWWVVGLGAVVLSQAVIASSWSDAKFGTIANLIILAGVVYGFASEGPLSVRADYRSQVRARLGGAASPGVVTEAHLAPLPEPIQRYLRQSGVVGQPRVEHFRAVWRGRIRGSATAPWMPFTAEQYNFLGEPARFFLMDARRSGLPVDVYHVFTADAAAMRVRLLSLVPLVEAGGTELRRAEIVTVFNDLAIMAPSALVDPAFRWEAVDARTARGAFTVDGTTVRADLIVNDAGELVDFVSDDRLAASADGTTFTRRRWSTPLGEYRAFGNRRVATRGEGRWHPAEGTFAYLELELADYEVNGPWR